MYQKKYLGMITSIPYQNRMELVKGHVDFISKCGSHLVA